MIDEDTQVELGLFAQEVLLHPLFLTITSQFETAMCQQLLSTKPHEVKARESIYTTFQGGLQFVDFMKTHVLAKDKILEKREVILDEDASDFEEENDC